MSRHPGHGHGNTTEQGAKEHDDLATVPIGQHTEDDGAGQLGGVKAAVQERQHPGTIAVVSGQVVNQEDEHPAGNRRANSQHERRQEHRRDGAIHWPIA